MTPTTYYVPRHRPSPQLLDRICDLFLTCLDAPEKDIMEMRLGRGLTHALNTREIGDVFGHGKEWAMNLENRAFSRVYAHVERSKDIDRKPVFTIPLEILGLRPRTLASLYNNGIRFADDLCRYTPSQLRMRRGIGQYTVKEIKEKLFAHKMGLNHKDFLRDSYATI